MNGDVWFGDYAGYMAFLDMQKRLKDPEFLTSMRGLWESERDEQEEDEDQYQSWLLERKGSTAILNVAGDLVNTKAWYNEYLGRVSYEEIQEALAEAGADDSVDQVLMHFSTGGGTASGIKAAGDYIQFFDQNVKPVYGYTGTAAFSAGYWLASSTRKISVDEMGQLGSIGAVNVHVSYKGMLDKEGIVYTILREGEFKALGHPAEDLDEKSKAYFQEKLAKANSFFLDAVMRNRSLSFSEQGQWGEGKTFYGREAVALGLADEVTTLQDLLGRFHVSRSGDGRTNYGGNMPKETLNADEAQQAPATSADEAVAGQGLDGLDPQKVTLSEADKARLESGLEVEGVDVQGVEKLAEEGQRDDLELNDGEELPNAVPEMGEEMKALVAERDALAEKLDAATALAEEMKGIVLDAANKKIVAMGGVPMDMSFLDAATAVQHHQKVAEKFDATFKVGQRSSAPAQEKPEPETGAGLSAGPSLLERQAAARRKQSK